MFDIQITSVEPDKQVGTGQIRIGAFVESFIVDLSFWTVEQYEQQWRQGLERILVGADSTCLVVSLPPPEHANFIVWWVIYRVGADLRVQNGILFTEEFDGVFDPSNPYRYIDARATVSEDGDRISEWAVDESDLVHWFGRT